MSVSTTEKCTCYLDKDGEVDWYNCPAPALDTGRSDRDGFARHISAATRRLDRAERRARWISEEPLTADDIAYGHGLDVRLRNEPWLRSTWSAKARETDPVWQATQPANKKEIENAWLEDLYLQISAVYSKLGSCDEEYHKAAAGKIAWHAVGPQLALQGWRACWTLLRPPPKSDPFDEWWDKSSEAGQIMLSRKDAHAIWDATLKACDQ